MTDDELRAVRERAKAATPGPWAVSYDEDVDTFGVVAEDDGPGDVFIVEEMGQPGQHDAEFIAHARQDIPRLLDEIANLRGAMTAQDDRESKAGEACGVPYELHGCDWPDAVAEAVQVLRAENASLKRQVASLMPMAPEQP